jgi:XTP/dITP diphosphohydrolase
VTAPRKLLFATGNEHKVDEVRAILGPEWVVEARPTDAEETADTFEGNALIKARALCAETGVASVADDSGIEVDALGGAPGVRSARWTDEADWVPKVLRDLAARPDEPRTCRYVAAVALARPDGTEVVVRGTVEGTVAPGPRGANGFGYDPIMVPDEGDGRTFGEMTEAEKHAISHRARAFRAILPHLT